MRFINKKTKEEIPTKGLFFDINGKERHVNYMTRISFERNALVLGEDGEYFEDRILVPYLEVIVKSRRTGGDMPIEWWEEEKFLEYNPHIEVLE